MRSASGIAVDSGQPSRCIPGATTFVANRAIELDGANSHLFRVQLIVIDRHAPP